MLLPRAQALKSGLCRERWEGRGRGAGGVGPRPREKQGASGEGEEGGWLHPEGRAVNREELSGLLILRDAAEREGNPIPCTRTEYLGRLICAAESVVIDCG